MANIKINDIKPAGVELFADYESFMDQLVDSELNNIKGGIKVMFTDTWAASCACPTK
jgi:hypothetical protein